MPTIQEVFKEFPYYVNIHFSDTCSAIEVRFYITSWHDGARGRELRVPDWYYEEGKARKSPPIFTQIKGGRGDLRVCIALKIPSSLRDEEKEMQLFLLRRAYFQSLLFSYFHSNLIDFVLTRLKNKLSTSLTILAFPAKAEYDIIASQVPFNRYGTNPIITLPPIYNLVTTILAIQNDKEFTQRVIDRFQNSDNESEQKLAKMLAEWNGTLASR